MLSLELYKLNIFYTCKSFLHIPKIPIYLYLIVYDIYVVSQKKVLKIDINKYILNIRLIIDTIYKLYCIVKGAK